MGFVDWAAVDAGGTAPDNVDVSPTAAEGETDDGR